MAIWDDPIRYTAEGIIRPTKIIHPNQTWFGFHGQLAHCKSARGKRNLSSQEELIQSQGLLFRSCGTPGIYINHNDRSDLVAESLSTTKSSDWLIPEHNHRHVLSEV